MWLIDVVEKVMKTFQDSPKKSSNKLLHVQVKDMLKESKAIEMVITFCFNNDKQ
jgi:hypothetical protein